MSLDAPLADPDDPSADYPTFYLCYDVDDPEDPSEVTVFSDRADEISTQWISVDAAHAVDVTDAV